MKGYALFVIVMVLLVGAQIGWAAEKPSFVLAIDKSGSMRNSLSDVQRAADGFIREMRAGHLAEVIAFDSETRVLQGFTDRKPLLLEAVSGFRAGGATRLYDTIDTAVQDLNKVGGEKILVLMTDGRDERYTGSRRLSKLTLDEAIDAAVFGDVPVFTVGLGPYVDRAVLTQIAEETGGQAYVAQRSSELPNLYLTILGDYYRWLSGERSRTGSLIVLSRPGGIRVRLDGQPLRSTTPVKVRSLLPGSHTVEVVFPGETWTEAVTVQAGRTTRITAIKGARQYGDITVTSEPSGAMVLVDKTFVGYTPVDVERLSYGTHVLSVKQPGYQDWEQRINVQAKQKTYPAKLSVDWGEFVVTSDTHPEPDRWYNYSRPEVSWAFPAREIYGIIEGYSYTVDQDKFREPGNTVDTRDRGLTVGPLEDGIWYVKVKAITKDGESSRMARHTVRVDTRITPDPSIRCRATIASRGSSERTEEQISCRNHDPSPRFTWRADIGEDPSGIGAYAVYFGRDEEGVPTMERVASSFVPEAGMLDQTGCYYLRMSVMDGAGNATRANTVFTYRFSLNEQEGSFWEMDGCGCAKEGEGADELEQEMDERMKELRNH